MEWSAGESAKGGILKLYEEKKNTERTKRYSSERNRTKTRLEFA